MTDISNKTLAIFLLAAMAVSSAGFLFVFDGLAEAGVTGRAPTDTAQTNFSIESTISVVFTTDIADFGAGTVNASTGDNACVLNTSFDNSANGLDAGAMNCTGFNSVVPALVVQNQGTLNVSLNMSFNATAAQFIGGSAQTPLLEWRMSLNESGSCSGLVTSTNTAAQDTNVSVCGSTLFNWVSGARTLNLDIGMKIPQDASPGERVVLITAHATNP